MVTPATTTKAAKNLTIDVNGVDVSKPVNGLAIVTPPQGGKFKIAADVIQKACADLPDKERKELLWFATYCRRKDFDKAGLGGVLRKPGSTEYYSTDSIIQLLTGGRMRRGENIAPMLEAIASVRRVEEMREDQLESGFIETRLYREIEKRLLKALKRQRVAFIFGDSQIGKTESLKEFARRHNHGQTIYVEMPASGSVGHFIRALALALGIPHSGRQSDLFERCIEAFDSRMILIVDEAHRSLGARFTSAGVAVFSWLRELFNRKGCAIGLSMTNEGRDTFLKGPSAKAFQQFWRRRITPLQLPSAPPDDDAALFANAYGLEPASDEPIEVTISAIDENGKRKNHGITDSPLRLQRAVLQQEGLGVWITILQDAADMSQEKRRPISWGAVIKAHAQAQAEAEMLD